MNPTFFWDTLYYDHLRHHNDYDQQDYDHYNVYDQQNKDYGHNHWDLMEGGIEESSGSHSASSSSSFEF